MGHVSGASVGMADGSDAVAILTMTPAVTLDPACAQWSARVGLGMPEQKLSKSGKPPTVRLGWEQHWDPHPMCWLVGTLRAAPFGWRSLGMRSCPAGGVAITLPNSHLLLGSGPVDRSRVTWSVHTHDPHDPEGHEPIEFGTFTWVRLDRSAYNTAAGVFQLPDGSLLHVADIRGQAEPRYRIISRADPTRLVSGSETWADLAAVEQTAARVYERIGPTVSSAEPEQGTAT